jgi:hypothetical protein
MVECDLGCGELAVFSGGVDVVGFVCCGWCGVSV